jgi:hypothetical protein
MSMQPTHDLSLDERRNTGRKIGRNALLISLLIHAVVFFFWRTNGPLMSPFAAAGPRAGDNRAAGGSMTSMAIRIPPPRPIVPPRIPLPTVTPDIMEFEPEVDQSPMDVIGDRPGNSPGPPGIEGGTGQGDGGTAEEGLFRLVPPSPRGMIMPPANDKLRGREVEVWVFVDERGRVVPDSTRLEPPTSDGDFNRRLIQEAAQWVFEPARQGGKAVASWFPYTIAM